MRENVYAIVCVDCYEKRKKKMILKERRPFQDVGVLLHGQDTKFVVELQNANSISFHKELAFLEKSFQD
jgi:hypothetical protein